MLDEYKDVLSIKDMCAILHIGKNTAYKLLSEREIPNKILGGKYIIPKQGLINYLSNITNIT